MLQTCHGVTLSRIMIDGKRREHLTPLNDVQKRSFELMKVPLEAITGG